MSSSTFGTVSLTQSPVNISTPDTPTQSFDSVLSSNYQSAPIEIFNNGSNLDGEFTTNQNYVTYQGEKYYLKGFHFHTQSENTFNGQNADGEIHLVHKSSTGKILVVGLLLDGVASNSPKSNVIDAQLSSFFGTLNGELIDTSQSIEGLNFDPSKLIAPNAQVYNYGGSLTTPPYSDATWVVASKMLTVNENDLQKFRDLQQEFYAATNPLVDANGFNNRDIQNELFLGTEGDDFIQGDRNGASDDLIYARSGNDTVNGGQKNDKIFGEAGADLIFAGEGDDLLVGDTNLAGVNTDSSANDILIGGEGEDLLYIYGDDLAVGGGTNSFDEDLVETLKDEPFEAEFNLLDGQQDTFVFVNKGDGYTATIVGFEAGIDRLDLRQYNLGSVETPGSFQDVQQKGEDDNAWWEYKTAQVNGAEVVLRIDANPEEVNNALL